MDADVRLVDVLVRLLLLLGQFADGGFEVLFVVVVLVVRKLPEHDAVSVARPRPFPPTTNAVRSAWGA